MCRREAQRKFQYSAYSDFGKATTANNGRTYPEFNEKKEKYKRNYPYLATELKAGGGRQTVYTDVYSFGYLMKVVSHSLNARPKMTEIEKALKNFKN